MQTLKIKNMKQSLRKDLEVIKVQTYKLAVIHLQIQTQTEGQPTSMKFGHKPNESSIISKAHGSVAWWPEANLY